LKRLSVFLLLVICSSLSAQGFLRRDGIKIVNDQGEVLLRGMGLGGWMLQEGYMLQTSAFANTQHEIRTRIESLIGAEGTQAFYDAWIENGCRKIDIDSLASWGFNSVRLPMHYNLFTLPIEQEPVKGENTWLEKGFLLTDHLLEWCKSNRIYLILDLHAAPGGQGKDASISDYDSGKPALWESAENRAKTVALWRRLAERYANEPWIGGYDLINETNWDIAGNQALKDLYAEITSAIRQVDRNHLLFIEGNWWANDFTGLTPPWDSNMAYSFHKYWNANDRASIQWMLDLRSKQNVPIWCGEAGENSNVWFNDAIRLLETYAIGWAWWPLKKVESISGPLSALKPSGYQRLLDYWQGNGLKPSAIEAKSTLMSLCENLKLENCLFHRDVIDAMFRQVQSTQVMAYAPRTLPGRIFSTDYDLGRAGLAYFDTEGANYQVSTGTYTAWNNGWSYRNDGVDIESCSDREVSNGYNIGWIEAGEWLSYTATIARSGTYEIQYRIAAPSAGGKLELRLMEPAGERLVHSLDIPATGGWQSWQTVSDSIELARGHVRFKLIIRQNGFNLNWLQFKLLSGSADDEGNAPRLWQNYPNPMRASTRIRYYLPDLMQMSLAVYNIKGQKVQTLFNAQQQAGEHELDWTAGGLPNGLYLLRLEAGGASDTCKAIVEK